MTFEYNDSDENDVLELVHELVRFAVAGALVWTLAMLVLGRMFTVKSGVAPVTDARQAMTCSSALTVSSDTCRLERERVLAQRRAWQELD